MTDLYRRVADVLSKNGYQLDRKASGSTRIWVAPQRPHVSITKNILDKRLAQSVLKKAGIKVRL